MGWPEAIVTCIGLICMAVPVAMLIYFMNR